MMYLDRRGSSNFSTSSCWLIVCLLFILTSFSSLSAQDLPSKTIVNKEDSLKIATSDSISGSLDSIKIQAGDTIPLNDSLLLADDFKSKVSYYAEDSIVYDLDTGMVYLYGNAWMTYEDIRLEADFIDINFNTKVMSASGLPDSTGAIAGKPLFKQGEDEFHSDQIRYNFSTKKGKITEVTTKDGDSYIHGAQVKKQPDNSTFIKDGYYTTCDAPHPHYYMKANKIKVIPNNKVVTGPADLYIMDVPTPLAIPFGFFPNKKGRASGILFPQYGESQQLGFFLKNGGYYLGLNDHFDLALTGDIYSKGSWRGNAYSNYAWKYRFNGNMSLNYSNTKVSRPEFPDYSLEKSFFIRWNHSQDAKSHPGTSFTANVNAGSATFYQYNLTNATNFLTNTFTSSIAWSKAWTGKPINLSVSLSHSQNNQTRDINLSLPSATFNLARRTPFKRQLAIGEQKWYEKIGVGLTTSFINSISTKDTLLFKKESLEQFRYGIQHSVPISTSFTVAKYFTVSPGITYNEKWYLKTIQKEWDSETNSIDVDTVDGFKAARDFAFSTNINTRIYGMLQFKKGKIAAFRHVMTPTLGFSWRPDFSEKQYGYYKEVQSDSLGTIQKYSVFEGAIFGGPGAGKSSLMNFSLDNNFEMKVRQKNDTAETFKKVKLLESLALSSSYNFAADSLRLAPISISGRATIVDRISLNLFGVFDPYVINNDGVRINKTEWSENNKLARFNSGNFSINFSILPRKKPLKSTQGTADELNEINKNQDDYLDYSIPFSLNIGYNFFFLNNVGAPDQITQTLNFSGDLQLTPAWKVNYNSGYDFEQKDFSYTSLGINRNLHCWEMSLNWVPFGFQQNYFFQINVKSSLLQDLKLTKKDDRFDNR
ncbi:MAG: LPS-assembly protein LptD [Bacteroidia bacterium]|nr:LPS-assembly protein LptD [Bacteroidia bacterium]MBP7243673.1 LPS-assembly protein LptD [Bacteroidia bacterium]